MSGERRLGLAASAAIAALALAPFVAPRTAFYHTWEYAALIALALIAVFASLRTALRARAAERRWALVFAAAFVVAGAALWSGLAGPDTEIAVGTPGTTRALPALGAAAFYGDADAAAIARGDAAIVVRRRNVAPLEVRGAVPRIAGGALVYAQSRPAAYIDVRDTSGAHLTVTQPANASFLSPILLFRAEQPIHNRRFPLDTFAAPAVHRIVRALWFTPDDLAAFRGGTAPAAPALVLSASDDGGRQRGLALATSGTEVRIADLRVRATLGSYPALAVAAIPNPLVCFGGIALGVAAALWALAGARTRAVRPAAVSTSPAP